SCYTHTAYITTTVNTSYTLCHAEPAQPERNLMFVGTVTTPEGHPMFRDDLLANKHILITGGGTGLGKGMAQRFLELGAEVYICGRREEVLRATTAELSPQGPIHALTCDVRNLDAVETMIDTIWKTAPLDILVN